MKGFKCSTELVVSEFTGVLLLVLLVTLLKTEWESTILEAKNLIRNKTLDSSILRKLLFLRQLEAISSFLSLVRSNAVAFISAEQSANASPKMHSEEELSKPIKGKCLAVALVA